MVDSQLSPLKAFRLHCLSSGFSGRVFLMQWYRTRAYPERFPCIYTPVRYASLPLDCHCNSEVSGQY